MWWFGLLVLAAGPERELEPAGPVARAFGATYDVSVASDGTGFFVAWTANGRMNLWDDVVYGARVTAQGQVLDREGLRLSGAGASRPQVAWFADANVWVVTVQTEAGTELRLRRPDGTAHPATATTPLLLPLARSAHLAFVVPGECLVTAENGRPVFWRLTAQGTLVSPMATEVSADGVPWGATVLAATLPSGVPVIAWTTDFELRAAIVSFAGVPTMTSLPVLRTATDRIALDALVHQGPTVLAAVRRTDGMVVSPELISLTAAGAGTVWPVVAPVGPNAERLVVSPVGGGLVIGVFREERVLLGSFSVGAASQTVGTMLSGFNSIGVWATPSTMVVAGGSWHEGTRFQRLDPTLGLLDPMPVQLDLARGGHRNSLAAPLGSGFVHVALRLTDWADLVVRRTDGAGLVSSPPDLVQASSRFERPQLLERRGRVGLLTGDGLLTTTGGSWTSVPEPAFGLAYRGLGVDRDGRFLWAGVESVSPGRYRGWAQRPEADGGVTQTLLFPESTLKPLFPRIAFRRDGGEGVVVISAQDRFIATRLSPDLQALDDGGFTVGDSSSLREWSLGTDPEDGFLLLSSQDDRVLVRRLVGTTTSMPREVVQGRFHVSDVSETPEGVLLTLSNQDTGALEARFLGVQGGVITVGPARVLVPASASFTNQPGVAWTPSATMFTYGRVDLDAGASTARYQRWDAVGPGGVCLESWECGLRRCVAGRCEGVPDGGSVVVDAGVDGGAPDSGVVEVDGGSEPDGGRVGVDGGGADDAGLGLDDGPAGGNGERSLGIGCDCSHVEGSLLWALGVLGLRRRRSLRLVPHR